MHRRSEIIHICNTMKPGQRVQFERDEFHDAFCVPAMAVIFDTLIYDDEIDHFMSFMVGSAYGCWSVREDDMTGRYVIDRNEEGDRLVWTEPDRRHLYVRTPDGFLERDERVPFKRKDPMTSNKPMRG